MPISGDELAGMLMCAKENHDKLTDEQKQKNKEIREAQMAEDKRAETIAKFGEMFAQADANGDGVLNREEYGTFMGLFRTKFAELGGTQAEESQEQQDMFYTAFNNSNSATDGVSLEDWMSGMKQMREAVAAIQAQNQ